MMPEELTSTLRRFLGYFLILSPTAFTLRRSEAGFERMLRVMTRNIGDAVEVRIRDNGGGIAPQIRDKIFDPFLRPSRSAKERASVYPSVTV
jgi:two-component system, NtrC family, sensor kinase